MAFDGIFIKHLLFELNEVLIDSRIRKIYQIGNNDFILKTRKAENNDIFISTNPRYQRIHITTMEYEKPKKPYNFCMFLRKYLEGGIIKNIIQHSTDRIITIEVVNTNELKDRVSYFMTIEFTGKTSNIVLTNNENTILDCLKRTSIDSERAIRPNSKYILPISDKIDPYTTILRNDSIISQNIVDNYMGISPLLAKEINYLGGTLNIINNFKINPTIFNNNSSNFYFTDLKHINCEKYYYDSISEMLDIHFFKKDNKDRVLQKSKNISNLIKRNITRNKNKLKKLHKEVDASQNSFSIKEIAEIIQANLHSIKKGMSEVTLYNFYTNSDISISLDPKLDAVKNMNKYYKKYKKLKISKKHLDIQIKLSENELKYFELVLEQINHIDVSGIDEIRYELEQNGYIKNKVNKKEKKLKPNYTKYIVDDIEILVGKNNLQNEYLTHKNARRNEWWFHAKDMAGSHVIVKSDVNELSENIIRTASNIAAYYSKGQDSSSVPVNYTRVKNIKKVPGMKNCFVTYDIYKTIYIDPCFNEILNLNKK